MVRSQGSLLIYSDTESDRVAATNGNLKISGENVVGQSAESGTRNAWTASFLRATITYRNRSWTSVCG